ncbi:MAG: SLAC1 family transporter [Roseinatronobacter sp.]
MTRRPMPPPLRLPKPGLWRNTPPAVFPPVLGLFGLGLGWRAAASSYGITPAIGDLILGATTLLFLFTLLAYGIKFLRRPRVLLEDMQVLPGRAGLAAASLSLMLLAASLAPLMPDLALGLVIIAFGAHVAIVLLFLHVLRLGPPEARNVSPVFHLTFVGFIVAGVPAVALGLDDAARALVWATLLPAGVIWGVSLRQFLKKAPPPPLRPLLTIHLAPACLLGIVAHGSGMPASTAFSAVAVILFVVFLASVRWLTVVGFSALWGAFTFPVAAFATAMVTVSGGQGAIGLFAVGALVLATLVVPAITFRVFKLWAEGKLAAKTNSAEA